MESSQDTHCLVADIGGTNTRVALAQDGRVLTDTVSRFRNADHPGLDSVLAAYLALHSGVRCQAACVALAGPVKDDRGALTNLDWQIDTDMLRRATGAQTGALLNDLQAQGHALGYLNTGSVRTLVQGNDAAPGANQLVIGVGTGFNVAPVFHHRSGRAVPPSEAGHANLPARGEDEQALARHLENVHGFPAIEDMLSGRGLERTYAWLAQRSGVAGEKHAADIMAHVGTSSDPVADQAAQMFVQMLGRVAGNLSLITLPFGGIFFAGGVARAFSQHFQSLGFTDAFRDKGRFAGFMQNFSVHVIEDDYAALTGCARFLASQDVA